MPGTIYGNDRESVRHGMSPLYGHPRTQLTVLLFLRIATFPADSGRIDQHLGATHSHQTGCFRIPLIPANQHTKTPHRGIDRLKA